MTRPCSWSRMAWVVSARSSADSVTGRPVRRDWLGDVDAPVDGDAIGEGVCPANNRLGVGGAIGRAERGDFADQLGGSPARLLLGDRADGPVGDQIVEVMIDHRSEGELLD